MVISESLLVLEMCLEQFILREEGRLAGNFKRLDRLDAETLVRQAALLTRASGVDSHGHRGECAWEMRLRGDEYSRTFADLFENFDGCHVLGMETTAACRFTAGWGERIARPRGR